MLLNTALMRQNPFIIIYREPGMMDCKPEKIIAGTRDFDDEPLHLSVIFHHRKNIYSSSSEHMPQQY